MGAAVQGGAMNGAASSAAAQSAAGDPRPAWALIRARDWRALAARDRTRFLQDVFLRPSIGPMAGLLAGGLMGLVAWLSALYADGAFARSCDFAGADAQGVIGAATGFWTIAIVSVLAVATGVEPIVARRASGWDWDGALRARWRRLDLRPGSVFLRIPRALVLILTAALYLALGWLLWIAYRTPSFVFSLFDWFLVRAVAVAAGTTLQPWPVRYAALFACVAVAALTAWYAPAPYGLFGAAGGILVVLAAVRRWTWVERDREAFLIARESDPENERVGFAEDLRDEALIAIVFLFVLIPLALRQIDLAYNAFDLVDGRCQPLPGEPGFWDWIGFFGAELAKAVPLVDWSEVFHVANGSPIAARTPLGADVVFLLRATLDLLLLAAVVQAVQIAARLREQSVAFWAGKLPILDPFAERAVFGAAAARLVVHPHVEAAAQPPVAHFPEYQGRRLRQIAAGVTPGGRAASPVLSDPLARRGAMSVLLKQDRGPMTAAALGAIVRADANADMRAFALDLLAAADAGAAGAELTAVLREAQDPALRAAAARALGRRRHAGASQGLLERLFDGAERLDVRAHAGLALAKLKEAKGDFGRGREPVRRLAGELTPDAAPSLAVTLGMACALFARERPEPSLSSGEYEEPFDPPKAEALAAFFAAPLRPHARRGIRSAFGELDQMVAIPDGTFTMGSPEGEEGHSPGEGPRREVRVAAFAMGKYAVTVEEYVGFLAATGREEPGDEGWGKGRRPVIDVSWDDAHAYCDWLYEALGERFRLPSEAEWEYACRAGKETAFSFGETISTDQANYNGNYTYGAGKKGVYRQKTVEVGSFPPNDFGLHDMHGNVWEWCADPWHESYAGAPKDGSAWLEGGDENTRVLRGGCWNNNPYRLRSANRSRYLPVIRNRLYGFRLARTLHP